MTTDYPYLIDAAKQLEAAVRRLRQVADPHAPAIVRRRLLREVRTNVDAADARMRSAESADEPGGTP